MLLEGFPEDAELNVIASAEAIRREAEVSSDQGITNLDSQVVLTCFLVTSTRA